MKTLKNIFESIVKGNATGKISKNFVGYQSYQNSYKLEGKKIPESEFGSIHKNAVLVMSWTDNAYYDIIFIHNNADKRNQWLFHYIYALDTQNDKKIHPNPTLFNIKISDNNEWDGILGYHKYHAIIRYANAEETNKINKAISHSKYKK